MAFDPGAVETVTVDSHGTIVDVTAAADALAPHTDAPEAVAGTWRDRSLTYAAMSHHLDAYDPFWTIVDRALDYAIAAHDVELSAADRAVVQEAYRRLDAFGDVRPGLERLVAAGYDVYVLSNGSPDMLTAMLEHTGLGELVTDAISADEIRTYKIAPALYRHAAERIGTDPPGIAHVSAGWFDAVGAQHVGMQGVWVNRTGRPAETWGPSPALTADSFETVADAFDV